MRNTEHYGVDPARISVCGDSAGGNLAAAVSQTLAGRSDLPKLRAQILIYPYLQALDFNLPSYQQKQEVPVVGCSLHQPEMGLCWHVTNGASSDRAALAEPELEH